MSSAACTFHLVSGVDRISFGVLLLTATSLAEPAAAGKLGTPGLETDMEPSRSCATYQDDRR